MFLIFPWCSVSESTGWGFRGRRMAAAGRDGGPGTTGNIEWCGKLQKNGSTVLWRTEVTIIGHDIGGIVIPAKMARLAKARRWSKRWRTCLSSPDLTATQISDGSKIQVRWRHVLQRYPTEFLSRLSNAAYVVDTLKRISYEIHLDYACT